MVPTEDGMNLISVLPDIVKSPSLTVEWENALSEIALGKVSAGDFMKDIRAMVQKMVSENSKPLKGMEMAFGREGSVGRYRKKKYVKQRKRSYER